MEFTTQKVVALTGITKEMLHYLCRAEIVMPTNSLESGIRGHGKARLYSFADLVICRVVKKLTTSGVSPLKIKQAIRELHKMGISATKLPANRVVIFEKSIYVWDENADPFRVADGQMAFGFILDLGQLRDEIVADIAKLAA